MYFRWNKLMKMFFIRFFHCKHRDTKKMLVFCIHYEYFYRCYQFLCVWGGTIFYFLGGGGGWNQRVGMKFPKNGSFLDWNSKGILVSISCPFPESVEKWLSVHATVAATVPLWRTAKCATAAVAATKCHHATAKKIYHRGI